MSDPILEVKGLKTSFFTDNGEVPAVNNVYFDLHPGEIIGIVGESDCGKSVTSLSIMGLVPSPPGKIVGGEMFTGLAIMFAVLGFNLMGDGLRDSLDPHMKN